MTSYSGSLSVVGAGRRVVGTGLAGVAGLLVVVTTSGTYGASVYTCGVSLYGASVS